MDHFPLIFLGIIKFLAWLRFSIFNIFNFILFYKTIQLFFKLPRLLGRFFSVLYITLRLLFTLNLDSFKHISPESIILIFICNRSTRPLTFLIDFITETINTTLIFIF